MTLRARLTERPVVAVLAALLLGGALLRVLALAAYWPGVIAYADSVKFLEAADTNLFAHAEQSAGYALFLRWMATATGDLAAVIGVQHLLGLATAALLYLGVASVTRDAWPGLVPAAVVLFSGDQLFLEHFVLSEAIFTFLVAAALCCALRMTRRDDAVLALAAGTALGLAAATRTVGLVLVPVLLAFIVGATAGTRRRRVWHAAVAAAAAGALLLGYAGLQAHGTGDPGVSRTGGWALYARTAQFADCARFDPPALTQPLCEDTEPARRAGANFYFHSTDSPARRAFGTVPAADERLGAFARSAILAQPWDYVRTVVTDVARFAWPSLERDRPRSGTGPDDWMFGPPGRYPYLGEDQAEAAATRLFGRTELSTGGTEALRSYQSVFRVHPKLLLVMALLAVAGGILARGRERAAIVLLGAVAAALIVVPSATLIFNWRYGIPATGPLAAAAALSGAVVAGRLRAARGRARHAAG